ncbi:MAG: hypothetical protein JJT85_12190 [Chromatiales bacterium]|nr:hypothetical protein [Chromatiales bacterium]
MTQEPGQPAPSHWWTTRQVATGRSLRLQLGPLELAVGHTRDEWCLTTRRAPESDAYDEAGLSVEDGVAEGPDERFVYAGDSAAVLIKPVLADRPVVIRPRQPVSLLAGQEVTLYLSTPVHLRIHVGDPPVLLRELPVLRLSDTWFGPSTCEGELSYAGRTQARHSLGEMPRRVHRAITPLRIRNAATTPLPLEKFSLPVPMLALYGADDGSLWTQRVQLVREDQSDQARLRIDSTLPDAGQPLTRLAAPREEPGRGGVVRAFSLLFGS